jgi:hypothetical protein
MKAILITCLAASLSADVVHVLFDSDKYSNVYVINGEQETHLEEGRGDPAVTVKGKYQIVWTDTAARKSYKSKTFSDKDQDPLYYSIKNNKATLFIGESD